MRVQLAFQGFVLIDDIFHAQLLVFEQHLTALPVLMEEITASRHNAGYQEITQRMKIMMKHGINGRHIEMLMQVNKAFAQQVTYYPGQHKRTNHLFPPDRNHIAIKTEYGFIQEKEKKKGKVRK